MTCVHVDMDGVLCEYEGAYARDREAYPNQPYPQSREGFYRELAPIPGAIDSMKRLASNPEVEAYILTAPSVHNPLSYTEKRLWVEGHLGFDWVERLIISPNKSLVKGDFLIDDHTEGRGQENFEGRLIHFGSEEFQDWSTVMETVMASVSRRD